MFPAIAAASSAIDALKALTSTKPTTGVKQDAPNLFAFSADASASAGAAPGSGGGTPSPISPETMNALFAAQSQSGPDASASLLQALQGTSSPSASNADGLVTASVFSAADSSYNFIDQLIPRRPAIAAQASSSLSVSV